MKARQSRVPDRKEPLTTILFGIDDHSSIDCSSLEATMFTRKEPPGQREDNSLIKFRMLKMFRKIFLMHRMCRIGLLHHSHQPTSPKLTNSKLPYKSTPSNSNRSHRSNPGGRQ
mmetsp:Transcript_46929/g.73456  ORF Transcript_46929/g.73456 Transcript_46929/m.73456 type:complete len:114 (-) Transcript_46929:1375-1716(-)